MKIEAIEINDILFKLIYMKRTLILLIFSLYHVIISVNLNQKDV